MLSEHADVVAGFVVTQRASLSALLGQQELPDLLCISDTHLLPDERSYGRDTPEELLDTLRLFPAHTVILLGDILESLVLDAKGVKAYETSARLQPLFAEIRNRSVLLVPGNHDQRAASFLTRWLGARVRPGGFLVGKVAFVHGHERDLDESDWVEDVAPWMVALGGALNRLGVLSTWGSLPNSDIAASYTSRGIFPIFGHTHDSMISPRFANSGCFLKHKQTFLTLQRGEIALWEGQW